MKNDVFVVDFSIRLPGIQNWNDIIHTIHANRCLQVFEKQTLSNGQKVEFGKPSINPDEKYFPQRQDAKIMRADVLAATVCAGELMNKLNLQEEIIPDIPLYISSGAFVENMFSQSDKIAEAFKKALEVTDPVKMKEMLFKLAPPLLALNTLTNATSSYVAQYSKIAGNNSTFGNTSISGAYAIEAAFNDIRYGFSELTVAGASNMGDLYSYLSFHCFFDNSELWRESTGAVLLFFANRDFIERNKLSFLCKIDEVNFSHHVPSLHRKTDFNGSAFVDNIKQFPLLVFSGAYTEQSGKQQSDYLRPKAQNTFSWFDILGNTGPVNHFMNILAAVEMGHRLNLPKAFSIDKDPYGRESALSLIF
jgi:hypothetical protein